MRIRSASLLLLLFILCTNVFAQKNVTTVGVQFKPIFPFNFLGTGSQAYDANGVHFNTELASGFSAGLFIRHNFSDLVGLEGGINYVKRKYNLTITDSGFTGNSIFRIVGYEIPVSAVIYARIGEKIYANGSLGPSLDMFASDIITFDSYFRNNAVRRTTFQPAVNANLGFEYRTEKSGAFYIGLSYHRPFSYIFAQATEYKRAGKQETVYNSLVGNYLTIDLRYFFHEDPNNKKKKS